MQMNRQKIILFVFVCLQSSSLFANEHRINLYDQQLDIANFDFYVERVLDARADQYCIGMVQKGLTNIKVPAFLGNGVAEELLALFSVSFKNTSDKKPLIVKVNELKIYEVTYTSREYAFAEVNVSFLQKEGDHYVELFEIGHLVEKSALDVTASHDDNISNALAVCFTQFRDQYQKGKIWSKPMDPAALTLHTLNHAYPIQAAEQYPKGVFKTFADFRNNDPDTEVAFSVEYDQKRKKEQVEAIPIWKDKTFEDQHIWGFSDGKNLFIQVDRSFYLLEKEERTFIVHAPSEAKGNAAVVGGILGGLVGALLFDALDASKGKEMRYKLDFTTGAIAAYEEPNYKRIEARSVLYLSSFEKEGTQISVFANGQQLCQLTPGTYYILRTKPSQATVEVCLDAGNAKTCDTIEPTLFKSEVYLCLSKKDGTPALESPNKSMQQSIWSRIKEGKAQELCK